MKYLKNKHAFELIKIKIVEKKQSEPANCAAFKI